MLSKVSKVNFFCKSYKKSDSNSSWCGEWVAYESTVFKVKFIEIIGTSET